MKHLAIILSFFLFSSSFAQQWDWVRPLQGDYAAAMDEDAFGNIYTAMGISANPDTTLLTKMDAAGNVIVITPPLSSTLTVY